MLVAISYFPSPSNGGSSDPDTFLSLFLGEIRIFLPKNVRLWHYDRFIGGSHRGNAFEFRYSVAKIKFKNWSVSTGPENC